MKQFLLVLIILSSVTVAFGRKKTKKIKTRANDDYSEFYEGGVTPDYAKQRKERIEKTEEVTEKTPVTKNLNNDDDDLAEINASKSAMSAAILKVQGDKKSADTAPTKMGMMGGMLSKIMPASVMQNFMKENPFSKMDKDKVRELILKAMNPKAQKMMKSKPNMLNFITDLAHDKKALPAMMGMLSKEKELKICGVISLVLFILSIVLNILNSKGNLFKKLAKKMAIMIGLLLVNIGCFYYFFHTELGPTVTIFKNNFF